MTSALQETPEALTTDSGISLYDKGGRQASCKVEPCQSKKYLTFCTIAFTFVASMLAGRFFFGPLVKHAMVDSGLDKRNHGNSVEKFAFMQQKARAIARPVRATAPQMHHHMPSMSEDGISAVALSNPGLMSAKEPAKEVTNMLEMFKQTDGATETWKTFSRMEAEIRHAETTEHEIKLQYENLLSQMAKELEGVEQMGGRSTSEKDHVNAFDPYHIIICALGALGTILGAIAMRPEAIRRAPSAALCATRRAAVTGGAGVFAAHAVAAVASSSPPGFEQEAFTGRVAGIGDGADILDERPPRVKDMYYPPSLIGLWQCERTVLSVEGDALQAEGAWRLLGGDGDIRQPEKYLLRYIPQPGAIVGADGKMTGDASLQSITGTDGKKYFGVVLDRGFEMGERTHGASVKWEAEAPDALRYERSSAGPGSVANIRVLQRSDELPSEQGWGSNELVRIRTPAFVSEIDYAVRVQRRFRRGTTETGARVVEGLEIVKTYRVLDGVAGVEMPTSTTKAKLRLTRPA